MESPSDNSPVFRILKRLRERGETVSFAESCTGGRASAVFATQAGVSEVFTGSVVAYDNAVKTRLLGVPESLLRTEGAVSAPVAIKMATGIREQLRTTWGVAITGIAGPGGGSPAKPVGTVFFGIRGPGVEETELVRFQGARTEIQQAAAEFAFDLFLRHLNS